MSLCLILLMHKFTRWHIWIILKTCMHTPATLQFHICSFWGVWRATPLQVFTPAVNQRVIIAWSCNHWIRCAGLNTPCLSSLLVAHSTPPATPPCCSQTHPCRPEVSRACAGFGPQAAIWWPLSVCMYSMLSKQPRVF